MKKHPLPTGFMPGIYFNLSNDEYHKDKALSHSGINKILVSLPDYWVNSPLNPDRKFKKGDAMKFGEWCHTLLLEPERFYKTYNFAGSKNYLPGKETLTSVDYKLVKENVEALTKDPKTAAYFKGGYPEVSIFVRDPMTGVMLRIRVDYLRTFGSVDLKRLRTITNNQLGWLIADHGYDLQDYLYRFVIAEAKRQLRAGKIKAYGNYDPAWLKAFMDDEDTMFVFFVQRSEPPFVYRILTFDAEIQANARARVEDGIRKYQKAIESYGEKNWPLGSPVPEEFSIYHLPRRIFDN